MLDHQRKAHARLLASLPVRSHEQRPPPAKRRGLGFMEDRRTWARVASKKSSMRGRKT